jgi:hypothetical protein
MSNRRRPAAENKNKLKWPALHICTGEGKARDPQYINIYFQAGANYINSYDIKEIN